MKAAFFLGIAVACKTPFRPCSLLSMLSPPHFCDRETPSQVVMSKAPKKIMRMSAKTLKELQASQSLFFHRSPELPEGFLFSVDEPSCQVEDLTSDISSLKFSRSEGKATGGATMDAGTSTTAPPEQDIISTFDSRLYLRGLSSFLIGRVVLSAACIPSTQSIMSRNFLSFLVGTVCVADTQLEGKGRGGNAWTSPLGCLLFSFTLQSTNGRTLPFLQYVASLAIVQGIESLSDAALDVKIKWPNDIYARGMKIGGVLCTSTYRNTRFDVVIGVGLNVSNREPTTCLDTLREELNPNAVPLKREAVLAAILNKFDSLFAAFTTEGFQVMEEAYLDRWLHSGQPVVLEETIDGQAPVRVPLTIQGLTTNGYLLAVDQSGDKFELHPDGNSFDFFSGLIRKKLDH